MPNSTDNWEVVSHGGTLRALERRGYIREPGVLYRPNPGKWGRDYCYVDNVDLADVLGQPALNTHTPLSVSMRFTWWMKLQYVSGCFYPFVMQKRRWIPGDHLRCSSGTTGVVLTLQQRYDGDLEQLKTYNGIYGVLGRLGLGHMTLEEAWALNPLTVGSVHPEDLQVVTSDYK